MKSKSKKIKSFFIGFCGFTLLFGAVSFCVNLFDFNKLEEKEKIEVNFEKYEKVATIGGGQDGEIHNGYLFSFGGTGGCNVYSMDDYSLVSSFTLNSNGTTQPHSNSVCFSKIKYSAEDEFPLLYSNIYNNDSSKIGVTNVYRVIKEENVFSAELVQVIKIGFTDDSSKWATGVRPYGNAVVDVDKNDYWAFVMDGSTNSTKFYRFDLPKITDGVLDETYGCNVVTLNYEDILTQFSTEYFNYVQGACYHDGKIYSAEGFTNDTTNIPTLRVIDLKEKKLIKSINLVSTFNLTIEPEFLDFYDNSLYYKDVSGNLYKFDIY